MHLEAYTNLKDGLVISEERTTYGNVIEGQRIRTHLGESLGMVGLLFT